MGTNFSFFQTIESVFRIGRTGLLTCMAMEHNVYTAHTLFLFESGHVNST